MNQGRTARLADLVKFVGGGTPTRNNPDYFGGDIPWVTPKDMKSWGIERAQVNITDAGLAGSAARLVPAGSVLVVVRSGVLKHTLPVGVSRVPVAINQDMKAVLCGREIHPDYLARLIKANSSLILSWVRATTADNFPVEKLKEMRVSLPSVEEQRRIAEILDRADELRSKRREALAQLDELARSIFLDTFGDPVRNEHSWPRAPMGSLLSRIHSGHSPQCLSRPASQSEWGVLKLSAITSCEFLAKENKALPVGVAPKLEHAVKVGDLLFSRKNTRDLVGACALVRETPSNLLLPDLIFRLELNPDAAINKVFLQQLLVYPSKRRQIQLLASGSAGSMPNISKASLMVAEVEVPPLALQQEFARQIEAIEELRAAQRASLAELDALFASLQDRAFRRLL
ncbi:restriction endonuclease subunit S [Micromonospora sp. WMMD723]|uniref:restriction endonuclease subunit S n=1 Tax=unclassified Micromonospora TaxID=2617518 RepID=UPI003B93310F